jgi:predicted nucleic acid-binding protein
VLARLYTRVLVPTTVVEEMLQEIQRRTGAGLGVLVLAHRRGLLDFETALARLSQTNFYLSAELVRLVRRRLSGGAAD